ncbi:MAG TPA: c-type cytochrome [Polyangiaceae bacterium]
MRATTAALLAGAVVVGACDDAGNNLPTAGSAAASSSTVVRGEYLVRSVAGCGECHTPRDASGALDQSQWLGGVANRFDLAPDDDTIGAISAPNLTPAGLSTWSDADVERAMLDGISKDGSPLFPVMPYYAYHNMTAADAQAIVAYLRALPSVAGTTPPRQPLPVALDAPAPPVPESAIPQTTLPYGSPGYAAAQQGRYLAGEVGFCLDCHTPWRLGQAQPLDLTRVFGGGRAFSSHDWVVSPPAPPVVWSYDVTPDPTGIAGWTADDVAKVLAEGKTPGGTQLCRPMPAGPVGGLGGLSAEDAHDIGVYLTTIPPVPGGVVPTCPAGAAE